MREIIFRAKQKGIGNWVYGNLIDLDHESGYVYISEKYEYASSLPAFELVKMNLYIVDPETVCQYTGITDKNGNKIFEGDIVKDEKKDGIMTGYNMLVCWKDEYLGWYLDRKEWAYPHYFGEITEPEDCRVIGNIFDDPSLLTED